MKKSWASQVSQWVKKAGDAGDSGWIPGSERSPGGETATQSNILAFIIPWTEEPDRLQSAHRVAKRWTWLSDWTTIRAPQVTPW